MCYHCYKKGLITLSLVCVQEAGRQSCYNVWKLVFINHGAMAPSRDKNTHQQVRKRWLYIRVFRLQPP